MAGADTAETAQATAVAPSQSPLRSLFMESSVKAIAEVNLRPFLLLFDSVTAGAPIYFDNNDWLFCLWRMTALTRSGRELLAGRRGEVECPRRVAGTWQFHDLRTDGCEKSDQKLAGRSRWNLPATVMVPAVMPPASGMPTASAEMLYGPLPTYSGRGGVTLTSTRSRVKTFGPGDPDLNGAASAGGLLWSKRLLCRPLVAGSDPRSWNLG